ncbi:dipeptide epimerase [candidate division KSB1 bacterium]
MIISSRRHDLHLHHPFRIARGVQEVAQILVVAIEEGLGEASPSSFYGETRSTVEAVLPEFEPFLGEDLSLVETIMDRIQARIGGNPAAKAAVDLALHDLAGKRLGTPLWRLLGLDPEAAGPTSFTIGIDGIDKVKQKVREAAQYPILKIKLGTERDLDIIRAVREETDKVVRVDANCGWSRARALSIIPRLADLGVEFVEQPLPAGDLEGLQLVRNNSPLPIIADESCRTAADIPRLAGVVDGINVKLMKCGGINQALKLIHAARAHDMMVMIGCMIESSLGITAAAQLTPLVDFADLDGHLLVNDDPFRGVTVEGGKLILPPGPGLGVSGPIPTDPAEGTSTIESGN